MSLGRTLYNLFDEGFYHSNSNCIMCKHDGILYAAHYELEPGEFGIHAKATYYVIDYSSTEKHYANIIFQTGSMTELQDDLDGFIGWNTTQETQ